MGAASSVSLSTQSWVQVEMESSPWRLTSCTEWAVLNSESPYLQESHMLVVSSVCFRCSSCGFWVFVIMLWISWWLMGSAIWVVVFQGHGAGCWASHMVPWSSREWDTMKPLLQWRNVKLGHTKGELAVSFSMGESWNGEALWQPTANVSTFMWRLMVFELGRSQCDGALRHLIPLRTQGKAVF